MNSIYESMSFFLSFEIFSEIAFKEYSNITCFKIIETCYIMIVYG